MPKAGDQIGPYTLVRKIGRGSFADVWLGEKRGAVTTTQFALKFARDDEIDLAMIRQEVEIWKQG